MHRGLEGKPLAELPVITKGEMMSAFDEFVTDPSVHLCEVQNYLENQHGDEPFLGRYWVTRT